MVLHPQKLTMETATINPTGVRKEGTPTFHPTSPSKKENPRSVLYHETEQGFSRPRPRPPRPPALGHSVTRFGPGAASLGPPAPGPAPPSPSPTSGSTHPPPAISQLSEPSRGEVLARAKERAPHARKRPENAPEMDLFDALPKELDKHR